MKWGFKLSIVLYISKHKNLIRHKYMLDFPDFSSSYLYECSESFIRNLRARSCKLSILFTDFLCENIHTTG